jgi:hypothetical protein
MIPLINELTLAEMEESLAITSSQRIDEILEIMLLLDLLRKRDETCVMVLVEI